jgi:transcriptional regulator with XRE-family HTH domain
MFFGKQVRSTRKALNLSQEELAHMAGINRSHMGQIERGKKNAGLTTVASIAEALNCSICHLLDDQSE